MSIIIGADLVPTKSNYDLFEAADIKTLFGEKLLKEIGAADYRIFNLETPITDIATPIKKLGPAIITPERVMPGLKALGVDLFAIANNHILDQGEQGLNKTVELIKENGMDYIGAGENLELAKTARIIELGGKKIGIYACTEHEFSIATEQSGGANPFDPLESFDHVEELKKNCDYAIVLYHGGKEHYRYPSPNIQKVCRKFIQKGANLVLCQHSHCIGCEEDYSGGKIVYGQGNFIFDVSNSECWRWGLLVKITDDLSVEYIPVKKTGNTVVLAEDEDAKTLLSDFYDRSEKIKQDGFIQNEFKKLAKETIYPYLTALSGKTRGFCFNAMNKITGNRLIKWYAEFKYRIKRYAAKNLIECESIRELIIEGINGILED